MSRSVLFTNNPSAYVHQILDRLVGKAQFGDGRAVKTLRLAQVPADLKPLVASLVGNKDSFSSTEVERQLSGAVFALQDADRGIFGKGLFGVIGGPDNRLSEREQNRAAKRHDAVRPVLDYIFEVRGEQ